MVFVIIKQDLRRELGWLKTSKILCNKDLFASFTYKLKLEVAGIQVSILAVMV